MLTNVNINYDLILYPQNKLINDVEKMIQLFDETLNYDELSKYLLNDITGPIFKSGKFIEIDSIITEITICNDFINVLSNTLNSILNKYMPKKKTKKSLDTNDSDGEEQLVYVDYNERDGYHLCLTKRRSELLQQYLDQNSSIKVGNIVLTNKNMEFRSLTKGNTCKIFIMDIQQRSDTVIRLTDELRKLIKEKYVYWLGQIYNMFDNTFSLLIEYICIIDFCKSGAKTAQTNNYIKPFINDKLNGKSFINTKNLRHPICEKLLIDSEYIPIDIHLGMPNHEGILLFGLNSVGKSTLQKSIGINLILAQIGYYVSASYLNIIHIIL